jgi:ribulose-phosphate 3-epimerase
MRVGLAIKPSTPIEKILPLSGKVDMVLVMTVEPGFGGQTLIPACLEKVKILRAAHPKLDIQVDGGITLDNLRDVINNGANVVVAGTLIFGASSPKDMLSSMRSIMTRSDYL